MCYSLPTDEQTGPKIKEVAQDYVDIKQQSGNSNKSPKFNSDDLSSSIILSGKWTEISRTGEHRCQLSAGREQSLPVGR